MDETLGKELDSLARQAGSMADDVKALSEIIKVEAEKREYSRDPGKAVERLTKVIELLTRIQVLSSAILSVLIRCYGPYSSWFDDIKYMIVRGSGYGARSYYETVARWRDSSPDARMQMIGTALFLIGTALSEYYWWTPYGGVVKQFEPDTPAYYVSYILNLSRGLLNDATELLDHYTKAMVQSTSENKVPKYV